MSKRPSDTELFALYHLGLDRQGTYSFRNSHQCARHLQVDVNTFEDWLRQTRLDSESVKRVDFNLSTAHADAQFVAKADVAGFVAATWQAFVAARSGQPLSAVRLDLDYDAIWGDEAPDGDAADMAAPGEANER